jgi:DegV family protein with EDD domain
VVKIITDTTAGLPLEIARQYHIPVIPQIINFGTESFMEGIDLDNAGFMQRLVTSKELPKTAAPPPELFVKEFERLVPLGEPILCIHPSTDVSGTVRSALIAAKDFPGADIRVIDTRVVASPLATLVQLAAGWAQAGASADEIEAKLRQMSPGCHIYFLVSTLEYLARGGRIGGAAALLGSVLQVKPILAFRDGRVEPFEKERTHKRALARLKDLVYSQVPVSCETCYLSVMHAGVPDQAQALAGEFCATLGLKHVPILDVPPAIVTHGGPGLLGVGFFSERKT